MENMIVWQTFWFYIILFIFIMYTILDGFDLGVGMILPFFRKKDATEIIDVIHPFWDGNEVWLIIGMGSVFAIFPQSIGSFLSGFYLPFLFLIFLFIFRAISFGFHYHGMLNKRLWEIIISVSSILIGILVLLILGVLYNGVEIDANRVIFLKPTDFIKTVPVLFALTGVSVFAFHGVAYLRLKTKGDSSDRVEYIGGIAKISSFISILIFFVLIILLNNQVKTNPMFIVGAAIAILSSGVNIYIYGTAYKKMVFFFSLLALIGVWLAVAGSHFPDTIRSSADSGLSLTVFNSSSGLTTMKTLIWIVVPMVFIVCIYSAFVFRIFGKEKNSVIENKEDHGVKEMKEYVICKACGYVMEKTKVKDVCPACGVPAKIFEPYKETISQGRRLLLSLDLHPVMVHFPQAITVLILVLLPLSMVVPDAMVDKLLNAALILSYLLPFTVLLASIAGMFDGKIRFRRITTPLLVRKMLIGGLFLIFAIGIFTIAVVTEFAVSWSLYCAIALAFASLICGSILGLIGVGLLRAKFPG